MGAYFRKESDKEGVLSKNPDDDKCQCNYCSHERLFSDMDLTLEDKLEIFVNTSFYDLKLDVDFNIEMDAQSYEESILKYIELIEKKIKEDAIINKSKGCVLNVSFEDIENVVRLICHKRVIKDFNSFMGEFTKRFDEIYNICYDNDLHTKDENIKIISCGKYCGELTINKSLPLIIFRNNQKAFSSYDIGERINDIGQVRVSKNDDLSLIEIYDRDKKIDFALNPNTDRIKYSINGTEYTNECIDDIKIPFDVLSSIDSKSKDFSKIHTHIVLNELIIMLNELIPSIEKEKNSLLRMIKSDQT